MYLKKDKLLVILGSTSTGKTDLALQLAHKFHGELVSVDSRQVYKGLDIGTGKMPGGEVAVKKGKGFWEMNGVKVWMYDVADYKKQYTVFDYLKDANKALDDILRRGKLPIIVGGTGLYLKALLKGLPNLVVPIDLKLRKQLNNLTEKQLQERLQEISLDKWNKMNVSDRQNPRRLVRAIELATLHPQRIKQIELRIKDFNILKIGLTVPREILYKRIDDRVTVRISQGMIEETEKLHKNDLSFKRMRQLGLEYGVLADYLESKIQRRIELVKVLQGKIHDYARRQLTWYKKEKNVYWIDITQSGWMDQVESKVNSWYYATCDQKN